MTIETILAVLSLFVITSFMNVLATLKTILVSKRIMNPVYVVVFIDALIFASILTKVTSSEGFQFTLAYALGKSFGVFIGGKLEEKLALGILEVDVFFKNEEKLKLAADMLRNKGYTVNDYLVLGMNSEPRDILEIILKRKELSILHEVLKVNGIKKPTLKIKNISKVAGKITTTALS